MKQYVDGLLEIIKEGRVSEDRTGTGTISLFGELQSTYNMSDGFPSLTLKNNWFKGIYHELLWFLDAVPEEYKKFGNTNIKYLVDHGVGIWNEWPYEAFLKKEKEESDLEKSTPLLDTPPYNPTTLEEFVKEIKDNDEFALKWGELGPVYGKQWMDWGGYDKEVIKRFTGDVAGKEIPHSQRVSEHINGINQIKSAIQKLIDNPDDRGNIVSAWNVGDLDQMALRPCHTMFQLRSEALTVTERNVVNGTSLVDENMLDKLGVPKRRLSLKLYQRSCDTFLGQPFNIASYSLLLLMIAQVTNQVPHKFIHTLGDAHIYSNHKEQVNKFLSRTHGKDAPIIDFVGNPETCHEMIGEDMGPKLPSVFLNPKIKNIEDFRFDDIDLINYKSYGSIKAPVAV